MSFFFNSATTFLIFHCSIPLLFILSISVKPNNSCCTWQWKALNCHGVCSYLLLFKKWFKSWAELYTVYQILNSPCLLFLPKWTMFFFSFPKWHIFFSFGVSEWHIIAFCIPETKIFTDKTANKDIVHANSFLMNRYLCFHYVMKLYTVAFLQNYSN